MVFLHKKEEGYTLLEMVLVIGLLSLFLGIAVPAYDNMVNNAKIDAVETELKTIEQTLRQYHKQNEYYPADNTTFSNLLSFTANYTYSTTDQTDYYVEYNKTINGTTYYIESPPSGVLTTP